MPLHDYLPKYDPENPTSLTIHFITEYYRDNLKPLFDAMTDDCVWIGPYERQWVESKKELLELFSQDKHESTFTMSDLYAVARPFGGNSCEVMLKYGILVEYPTGEAHFFKEHLYCSWRKIVRKTEDGEKVKEWKLIALQVTGEVPSDSRNLVYQNYTYNGDSDAYALVQRLFRTDRFVVEKGFAKQMFFLPYADILYAESQARGALIHTIRGETYSVSCKVQELCEKYSDLLVRSHISYAVNPLYVREIRRRPGFQLELADKTILPIPEKSYTKVRAKLEEKMQNK